MEKLYCWKIKLFKFLLISLSAKRNVLNEQEESVVVNATLILWCKTGKFLSSWNAVYVRVKLNCISSKTTKNLTPSFS